jgi:hypothetical protein
MQLILHAGTPKTGTSSLQVFMDSHRAALLGHGVLYPDVELERNPAIQQPKHQWLVNALMTENYRKLECNMDSCLSQTQHGTHTIILSSEGLFKHWWDISLNAKKMLSSLLECYGVKVFVFFREPLDYACSLYRQFLINPQNKNFCHGTCLSLEAVLDNVWFQRQLRYHEYVEDVEQALGSGVVCPIKYSPDKTITKFFEMVVPSGELSHYARAIKTQYRENQSIQEQDIQVARFINWLGVKGDKKEIIRAISATRMPQLILSRSSITDSTRRKVATIAAPSLDFLADKYGIVW